MKLLMFAAKQSLTNPGLGHLAIQFASKMGCNVVVLSGSDKKKQEALDLGANEFIATKGAKELKISRPLDRLLVTTAAQPNWEQIVGIMAPNATIHPISIAGGNFSFPYRKYSKLAVQPQPR